MQKLTNEERQSFVLQHRHERDKRICDRIKAVLLRDEGWTFEQIAHVLLLTKEAIRQHIDDYETLRKLKPANGGSEQKLSAEQSRYLEEHLREQTYLYVNEKPRESRSKFLHHSEHDAQPGSSCSRNLREF